MASAMWSPRRVASSVTNSRNAVNEAKANSAITPALPKAKATPIAITITHQDLMGLFRFSMTAFGPAAALRRSRTKPMTDATSRMPTMPANNASVCCVVVIGRARHQADRILLPGLAIAIDRHRAKHALADVAARAAHGPIVGAGDRARQTPQRRRQHSPDQHEVAMTVVVGKVHARARIGL